ncbi:MAG: DUF6624 domain-containing protein [Bacteroidia bacterium]
MLGNQVAEAQRKLDPAQWDALVLGKDTIYRKKPSPADLAMKSRHYSEAVNLYLHQIKLEPCHPAEYNNLAIAYVEIGKLDSALFYLSTSLDIDPRTTFLEQPHFIPLINTQEWKDLEAKYVGNVRKYGLGIKNVDLALELWKMMQTDQAYYSEIDEAESKWGPKCKVIDSLWALKNPINERNLKRLEEIVKESGWPSISEVGSRGAVSAFIIIQHADLEIQKKYEPIIEKAANEGEAHWRDLALLIDRIRVKQNLPQLYGSQLRWNEEKKSYSPQPIEDESNLDLRRKKVGLNTAAEYYKNWNIVYTVPQNN